MKVLILSCKTGGGHDAAGMAVKEELEAEGHEAVLFDYLVLAGQKVSQTVGDVYVNTVKKAPLVFGLVYKLGMAVSRITRKSPVYYVNAKMGKYLQAYLGEEKFDAIVMPHLYPAETLTYMKRQGVDLPPLVAVMTDYTCIPFWEETRCDYYITPHKVQEYASIVVICGGNKKIFLKMKKEFAGEDQIFIIGQTKQMDLYMKACDILYTKPGGLTSTEAAVSGIPIVHTEPIPGCETANRKFFARRGMSLAPRTLDQQICQGRELLESTENQREMAEAQRRNIPSDSAVQIVKLLEQICFQTK